MNQEDIEKLKKTVARYTEPYEIGSIEGEYREGVPVDRRAV